MTTPKSYELVSCQHQLVDMNCKLCGVYLSSDCEAYKTFRYWSEVGQTNQRYLRTIRNKSSKYRALTSSLECSESIYDFLQTIVDKFEFTIETMALGMMYYGELLEGSKIQYSTKWEFYSSVCLMVAAKAIELDRKIPYYSRFLKYACREHTKDEYQAAEKEIMERFGWDLQRPTFVTFLNFFLSNGVAFSDDEFSRKKVFLIQEKIKELMHKSLRNGEFLTKDPLKYAAWIVDEARREFKLSWHRCLEAYSGLKVEMFRESDILKPLSDLQTPLRSGKSISKYHSTDNREFTTASNDKNKEASNLKAKVKPQIHRPLLNNHQLKFVPSFSALNLLSLKKAESSNN